MGTVMRTTWAAFLLCAATTPATAESVRRLRSGGVEPLAFGVTDVGDLQIVSDWDNDGLDDGWEEAHGTDPLVADAESDPDGDGLTNGDEFALATDPYATDSDTDGVADAVEATAGSDPVDPADTASTAPALV